MDIRANYKITESGMSRATSASLASLMGIFDPQITDETFINRQAILNMMQSESDVDSFGTPYVIGDHKLYALLFLPFTNDVEIEDLSIFIADLTFASFKCLAEDYIFVGYKSDTGGINMPVFAHEDLSEAQIEKFSQRFKESQ